MAGCSLPLMWLDDGLEGRWRAPCDTPALRKEMFARPNGDYPDAATPPA